MFQYSPRVRGNNCVSLAFPRGFLVPLSPTGGMAYLGELIKIVLIIPHMENKCLGKLVRHEPWLNRGGQVDIL